MQITFYHFMQSSVMCVIEKRSPKSACAKLKKWPLILYVITDSFIIFLGAKMKSYICTMYIHVAIFKMFNYLV